MGVKYYISTTPRTNGSHTVHKDGCPFLPGRGKQIFLGNYQSVKNAVAEGRKYFKNTGCCIFCMKEQSLEEGIRILAGSIHMSCLKSSEILNDSSPENVLFCCTN
jgi:hypothetical protein